MNLCRKAGCEEPECAHRIEQSTVMLGLCTKHIVDLYHADEFVNLVKELRRMQDRINRENFDTEGYNDGRLQYENIEDKIIDWVDDWLMDEDY